MSIIDFDSLKEAYEEELEELLQVFKEDADSDFQSLIKAADDGDHSQVKQFAHKIKGSSMVVMDQTLERLAAEIEKNHMDTEALKPFLDQLKSHYPRISNEIGEYLS